MKWLSLLAIVPTAAAFQTAKPSIHHRTSLNFYPEKFARAEECATHYGTCPLGELDELVDELAQFEASEGTLQGRDDYKDTHEVLHMLRAQTELQHEMEEYTHSHHKPSYSEVAWMNNTPGLGVGLW